jgi:hypothetical protein
MKAQDKTSESVAMIVLRWEPFDDAANTLGVCIKDSIFRRGLKFQLGQVAEMVSNNNARSAMLFMWSTFRRQL